MAEETDLQPGAEGAPEGAQSEPAQQRDERGRFASSQEAGREPEPQSEPEPEPDLSPEGLASQLGWSPKENWRGNEDDWVDAPTFLRNTVDINKSLRRDLKATREASERAARAAASITERAVEQERARLSQAAQLAWDTGDARTFQAAQTGLASLPAPPVPAQSPESTDFRSRNASWYGIDPIATQIAYNVCEAHKAKPFAEQLQEAEKVIRQRFPEYFQNRPGKGPAAVDTGQSRATATVRRGPKGYNELPADAKKAAQDFARRGRATVEEYAKLYWEENA